MPRQRFLCPRCGFVGEIFYPPPVYDADHNRLSVYPACPECRSVDYLAQQTLVPYPDRLQHDLLTGGTGLVVENERGQDVTISSLGEIRTIERESLRRASNGDGSPMVFRGFSQNRSNRGQNTLRGSEFEKNRSVRIERPTTVRGLPIRPRVISESEAPK
jgi:hypothetical protein